MPIAAISSAVMPALRSAVLIDHRQVAQISSGMCSTQPELGKCWVNSILPSPTIFCLSSKTMARLDVVPWSIANTWSFIAAGPPLSASSTPRHVGAQLFHCFRADSQPQLGAAPEHVLGPACPFLGDKLVPF